MRLQAFCLRTACICWPLCRDRTHTLNFPSTAARASPVTKAPLSEFLLIFPLSRPHADVLQVPACAEICLGAVLSFAATARGGAPTFFRKESRQRFARGSAPLTPVSVLPRSHAPPSPEARPACGDFAPPNAGHLTGTGLQSSIAKVPCALGLRARGKHKGKSCLSAAEASGSGSQEPQTDASDENHGVSRDFQCFRP